MTYADFELAFKEGATAEQIEAVNRYCAEVEGIEWWVGITQGPLSPNARFKDSNDDARYVQDFNNSERLIRKAIEADRFAFARKLIDVTSVDVFCVANDGYQSEMNVPNLACAPQSARLYAAVQTLMGAKR